MKLYVFGSCSGTEPMEGRHHTSIAFEINDRFYWFDAGENCSYTAHLMGVDLLKISDIFISHTHMDHIGGLANLLWNIRKLVGVKKTIPNYGNINVHIPKTEPFDGVMMLLRGSEGGYKTEYETIVKKISDGVLLKNDDVEVEAIHNFHLQDLSSHSFCVKAEGKRIVYSGDVKSIEDLDSFLKEKTDLLLMETGHHSAPDVLNLIGQKGYDVDKVYFMHHGREILYDYDGVLEKCRKIRPDVLLLNDKDVIEL